MGSKSKTLFHCLPKCSRVPAGEVSLDSMTLALSLKMKAVGCHIPQCGRRRVKGSVTKGLILSPLTWAGMERIIFLLQSSSLPLTRNGWDSGATSSPPFARCTPIPTRLLCLSSFPYSIQCPPVPAPPCLALRARGCVPIAISVKKVPFQFSIPPKFFASGLLFQLWYSHMK